MRLIQSDIDKRLQVKLNRKIKTCAGYADGFMSFGENNDYPQMIELLINSSSTGKICSGIYSKFLTGHGFENESINNVIIGKDLRGKKVTLSNLLRKVSKSIANNNGFYIHNNFNLNKEVVNSQIIPFKFCRFSKIDETGYTSKIYVYDWENKINTELVKSYNIWNVNQNAFNAQIKENGIENFKGQIFYGFLDDDYVYPLSPFDPVYLDLDTEAQDSIFMNNEIRNGLVDKTILRVESPNTEEERQELHTGIKKWMGADGDKVLILEDEIDQNTGMIRQNGAFAIDKIESNVNDKLFESWEQILQNRIRKSIRSIPKVFLDYDSGIFGASGESIIQATNYYNAVTSDDRNFISECFKEIFSNSVHPELKDNLNWNIKELVLYKQVSTQPINAKL